MSELHVEVFSHNFACTRLTPRARAAVGKFAWRYVPETWEKIQGTNRFRKVPDKDKAYLVATEDREEFRFHINLLKEFKEHLELNFLKGDLVEWATAPILPTPDVYMTIKPQWQVRDYQEPVIAYLTSPDSPRSKFVDLQTGKGKSFCTMKAQTDKHGIAVLVIRPMYIEKWLIDLRKTFELEVDDVIVAQGSEELMGLLDLAASELTPSYKWVIISNKTAQNWLKLYEKHREETTDLGYACYPHQLFQHLKARTRVIDEVHQDFLLNFKFDCITHVEDSVSLSATLIPDDDFKKRMAEIAYPGKDRFAGLPYDKYITGRAVMYSFKDPTKIRLTARGSNRYSHNVFEQSIMKSAQMTENYMQMINMLMRGTYLKSDFYRPGDKCVLFFASIAMCTHATEWFKRQYPDKTVMRYVEEDPYENLMTPDIRCTTLMSAGTAVDVPGLTTTLLTTAVKSSQSNVQGLGRLRKLDDGRAPIFVWLNCQDFPKHIDYHEHRKALLEPLMVGYRCDQIGILI